MQDDNGTTHESPPRCNYETATPIATTVRRSSSTAIVGERTRSVPSASSVGQIDVRATTASRPVKSPKTT